jgi:hypothetical protein
VAPIPAELIRLARDLLKSWPGIEPLVRGHGNVGQPIPVEHPRGVVTHWFVPIAVEGSLAGYFLFDANRQLQSYSSFLRRNTVEGAPDLGSWTNVERVSEVAARAAHGRKLGEPFLTYDGVSHRLAWAVPLDSDGDGVVYVAGDFAYSKPLDSESTG